MAARSCGSATQEHSTAGTARTNQGHRDLAAGRRERALAGFDFETAARRLDEQQAGLIETYPWRVRGRTPNQMVLSGGALVEGDTALYAPVVLADPARDAFRRLVGLKGPLAGAGIDAGAAGADRPGGDGRPVTPASQRGPKREARCTGRPERADS